MDEITIESTLTQKMTNWDAIVAEVNAWRGECVHHFSAVEVAVTETLLTLSEVTQGGAAVRLRHLIGQRLEDLTAAIAPVGPFHQVGKTAHSELLQYRERHELFRNLLCHGFVKVSVERNDRWVLVLRAVAINGGKAERKTVVLDQIEALDRLDTLKRDGGKLNSLLGQLRKAVAC